MWECRQRRRDGTRERVRILDVNGRRALIESENPRPPKKHRREVGLLINEITGDASLTNMRLVEVDGQPVTWHPVKGMVVHAA